LKIQVQCSEAERKKLVQNCLEIHVVQTEPPLASARRLSLGLDVEATLLLRVFCLFGSFQNLIIICEK
jgi:hypothetical protein